jgi:hypothetical protein
LPKGARTLDERSKDLNAIYKVPFVPGYQGKQGIANTAPTPLTPPVVKVASEGNVQRARHFFQQVMEKRDGKIAIKTGEHLHDKAFRKGVIHGPLDRNSFCFDCGSQ